MLCVAEGEFMLPQPHLGPVAYCLPAVQGTGLFLFTFQSFRDPFSRGLRAEWCRSGASPDLLTGRPSNRETA